MEPLLGVKIGCLFSLLVLTLVCGLIPICFKWFQTATATGCHRRVLSLLGCTSAGVFLGAGFMHMTAEALEGIESEIRKLVMQNKTNSKGNSSDAADSTFAEYPYGELIISLGFFFVFLLESLALQCCTGAAGRSEVQEQEWGLAVGLQPTVAATVQLCLAVLAHKGLVVFGVGLRLVQVGTGSRWAVLSILSLALMSPLGLALGLAVPQEDSTGGRRLAQAVLEGMAAGTFLYVTFLEILPRELASPEAPLAKWGCVAAGFAFMAFIALWA
ncbi:zinc transporter ZIP2 isoform X2 [Hippopotamus amphibius kiboko]|uniref:zinc transporter ZIP2 isoform X2 n=1 Tax=Hippopotamus amphibius kiboko TaxID=575201 RepID=UPI00259A07A9|nr:zinc transporter ZIP2 isoform X2 [Hippopotamus amphibius kiboko]